MEELEEIKIQISQVMSRTHPKLHSMIKGEMTKAEYDEDPDVIELKKLWEKQWNCLMKMLEEQPEEMQKILEQYDKPE